MSFKVGEFLREDEGEYFRIVTDFGVCYSSNMMSLKMIYTEETHEDLKKITKQNVSQSESEPNWTPELGLKPNTKSPLKSNYKYFELFTPYLNGIDKENVCETKNFFLFIHKPNEIVTPYHDVIFVNYEEKMDIKLTVKSLRTDPALRSFGTDVRKCYFEGERKLKFFKTYTKALCEWECLTNATLDNCGCVKFSMPRNQTTKVCNATKVFDCVLRVKRESRGCTCYAPCNDVEYSYKIYRSQLNRMSTLVYYEDDS